MVHHKAIRNPYIKDDLTKVDDDDGLHMQDCKNENFELIGETLNPFSAVQNLMNLAILMILVNLVILGILANLVILVVTSVIFHILKIFWVFNPPLQQNYTGHETTPCWNLFFWSFLSKT